MTSFKQFLAENNLQSIVKKFAVPIGTMKEVFGDICDDVCILLRCSSDDTAYELKASSPQTTAAVNSMIAKADEDLRADDLKIVNLIGKRKVLVWKGRAIMSVHDFDSLVKSS